MTEVPFLASGNETLALRWMGHSPSDEITAMLAVNRARSWTEFRAAVDGFAVTRPEHAYADSSGHIGRLMAVHLPRRLGDISDDMAINPRTGDGWDAPITSADLPCLADPPEGFITSANERPPDGNPFVGRHSRHPIESDVWIISWQQRTQCRSHARRGFSAMRTGMPRSPNAVSC